MLSLTNFHNDNNKTCFPDINVHFSNNPDLLMSSTGAVVDDELKKISLISI